MRRRYPTTYCPRCGKLVEICITARRSAPGETRWHRCSHGNVCSADEGCDKCEPDRLRNELTSLHYSEKIDK